MSVIIVPEKDQAAGAFDDGRIQERKPVGFPQEGGKTSAYSSLFYWAHAWSDQGGLIGEHPHKGFEILSFVLKGGIEHYDSANKGWKKLSAGDVQVIHAGSGISHAEKINQNSSIFQIWFDPDLSKALAKPASYKDFTASSFPVFEDEETKARVMVGGTELRLDAAVDYIQEITFKTSAKTFELKPDTILSFFVLEGSLMVNGQKAVQNDFVIIREETSLKLTEIEKGSRIFIIKTPLRPGYRTYAEMYQ